MSLVEALKVIKETCQAAGECERCPLRDNYNESCQLIIEPRNWMFADETIPPRVFK